MVERPAALTAASTSKVLRIDHVADGDTVDLTNGARVTLVQVDTPDVYFSPECYGRQASALTKRLLRPGTEVLLTREAATDSVDSYGRLLRYVIRRRDGLDINVHLVAAERLRLTSTRAVEAVTRPSSCGWHVRHAGVALASGAIVRERLSHQTGAFRRGHLDDTRLGQFRNAPERGDSRGLCRCSSTRPRRTSDQGVRRVALLPSL
jgi:hypothetical protein